MSEQRTADQRTCKHVWEGPRSLKHCAVCGYVEGTELAPLPSKPLVQRLRESAKDWVDCGTHCDLEEEAALEIERLEQELNIEKFRTATWRGAYRGATTPDEVRSDSHED